MQHEISVKVVVVGMVGVGKSSLTLRYVNDYFHERLQSTLGAVYYEKSVTVRGNTIKLLFWDTAGQQKYKAIARIYYKDCKVALLLYDVTKPESFVSLKQWAEQVRQNGPENVIMAIAGNKVDLQSSNQVPYEEVIQYAKSIGAIFKYTSAKDGKGVEELFTDIIQKVIEEDNTIRELKKSQRLSRRGVPEKKKCC